MGREIKFRSWNTVLNKMMPLKCLYFDHHDAGVVTGNEIDGDWSVVSLSFLKLLQFTGLKDKNGCEIYEGDIVELNDFDSLRTGGHTEDNILQGSISFSCGGWIVKTERGHYDLYTAIVNDEELEVIGNIYENPELLEESR